MGAIDAKHARSSGISSPVEGAHDPDEPTKPIVSRRTCLRVQTICFLRVEGALDDARVKTGMSKAELARLVSAKPEIVRRLFTAKANPTLETFTKIAAALGYRLELVQGRKRNGSQAAA